MRAAIALAAAALLAAPAMAANNPRTGRAFVLSGATGAPLRTLMAPDPINEALFGLSVAGVGDVNGDTIPDLAVGAPGVNALGVSRSGRAYLFSGADGSLIRAIDPPAPDGGARFGFVVAATGDLDGDGAGDLVVGAPKARSQGVGRTGEAYFISGMAGTSLEILRMPVPQKGARFAFSAASGRDVTGDGVTDIMLGAPSENVAPPNSSKRANQGRVYVFSGQANCLGVDPLFTRF